MGTCDRKGNEAEMATKMPLRRLELALNKFTRTAIPLHLELLTKHKDNIRKFQVLGEWDRVHKEQVNASRTVQQLTSDIWEVDRVRQQICEKDLAEFDRRIMPFKLQALEAIHEFIDEHKEVADPCRLLQGNTMEQELIEDEVADIAEEVLVNQNETAADQEQIQLVVEDIPQHVPAVTSWHKLKEQLLDLNQLIHTFSNAVTQQQPAVDQIEGNLDDTYANVHQGTTFLNTATKLKVAMYPVAGALIGCMAGPVGMLAGAKIGLAAALGGGLVGFAGGKYLKERQKEIADVEMTVLNNRSIKGSVSLPDVTNNVDFPRQPSDDEDKK